MSTAPRQVPNFGVLERIRPLMQRKGVVRDPMEFHHAVNLTFHAWESHIYDRLHRDMAETLPRVWTALAKDLAAQRPFFEPLRVLDVGCGTGLSTELFLKTSLASRVEEIHLLDPSEKMLDYCRARPCLQGRNAKFIEGVIEDLPASATYDLIIISSVLHHLVDLAGFCKKVTNLQRPGGVFLHIQDPNGDALVSPELNRRMSELDDSVERKVRKLSRRLSAVRAAKAITRRVTGKRVADYIDHVNAELVAKKVIAVPLTAPEIWSITDIRVTEDLGISLHELQNCLPDYERTSEKSYSFFGDLAANLPFRFRREEERLWESRSMEGMHVAAAWSKNPRRGTRPRP